MKTMESLLVNLSHEMETISKPDERIKFLLSKLDGYNPLITASHLYDAIKSEDNFYNMMDSIDFSNDLHLVKTALKFNNECFILNDHQDKLRFKELQSLLDDIIYKVQI